MTFKEKYLKCETWHDKAIIINFYHKLKCHQEHRWSIRKTARYFEKSIGFICEEIQLAESMDNLIIYKTRKDALLHLKENKS